MALKFNGIDHVHVYVSDRTVSQQWYEKVLGFQVVDKFLEWATDTGPLTMEDAAGSIHLALFEANKDPGSTIAFNADAESFLDWKSHLENEGLEVRLEDHKLAWSIYFFDPDRNYLEITTFEYAQVAEALTVN